MDAAYCAWLARRGLVDRNAEFREQTRAACEDSDRLQCKVQSHAFHRSTTAYQGLKAQGKASSLSLAFTSAIR